ncbi:unnamed protein product [Rotaria sp. Silwood2]|nr:unnamed protein product [Rotaria sp. Silwood2]CAF2989369.1 unnamed protein product [Rotaria sp. Silwood2]CAF3223841.1 unnamed protein product [Rotaria sp. Silwood2]CAF3961462.1 unnamed protein product [Rotaria sp. Silwood2]CAF4044072.1 unnamed protein product [Rotaria sp. Silwood2]
MTSKIIETSKNPIHQEEDLNKLKQILMKSDYPKQIVEKHIMNTIKTGNTKLDKQQNNKNKTPNYTITLPYVPGIDVLKRKLEKLNIKIYFSYPNKIQTTCTNIIKPKSKSNIYQINCNCGATYNGETKVGLKKCITQHNI